LQTSAQARSTAAKPVSFWYSTRPEVMNEVVNPQTRDGRCAGTPGGPCKPVAPVCPSGTTAVVPSAQEMVVTPASASFETVQLVPSWPASPMGPGAPVAPSLPAAPAVPLHTTSELVTSPSSRTLLAFVSAPIRTSTPPMGQRESSAGTTAVSTIFSTCSWVTVPAQAPSRCAAARKTVALKIPEFGRMEGEERIDIGLHHGRLRMGNRVRHASRTG